MFSRINFRSIMYNLLTIAGLVFATLAYRTWHSSYKILENGLKTEGVVTEIESRTDSKKGTTTYAPTVQFKTQKGEALTYYSSTFTNPCSYAQGQLVPIWYMPENPQEATLKPENVYSQPLIIIGYGILAFLFLLPLFFQFVGFLVFRVAIR